MSDFTQLVDLASERVGGVVLAANDEFFAPKENLLRSSKPVFLEDKYTDRGKWMDGWETRRRREPGHDWAIVQLGLPGAIKGAIVDTSHFTGNYPAQCSLEACAVEKPATQEVLDSGQWVALLPQSDLKGDSQNLFAIESARRRCRRSPSPAVTCGKREDDGDRRRPGGEEGDWRRVGDDPRDDD
ncbi:MAG: hypothetical protein L0212_12050, partial [Acidobacteria bacterium]|nr:hypothetical protein [Acidobacteriota bacterium]